MELYIIFLKKYFTKLIGCDTEPLKTEPCNVLRRKMVKQTFKVLQQMLQDS